MKRLLAVALFALGAAATSTVVLADTPPPSWPPGKSQVFIWADTVTAKSTGYTPVTLNKQENFFPQTSAVLFRSYAVDLKTGKVITPADVKFAYVHLPNSPTVKLAYGKQGKSELWTGTWTIPADYPLGVVNFMIHFKTKSNRVGTFIQAPVAAAQLTVVPKP